MIPPMTDGGLRAIIRQRVRACVYQTFRQNNNVVAIRLYIFTEVRRMIWRNHLIQLRMCSTTLITSWFPDWLAQWRPLQPVQRQPTGGGEQRDPRRLTVEQLVQMMGEPWKYMVHGTLKIEVGKLQGPPMRDLRETSQEAHDRQLAAVPIGPHWLWPQRFFFERR